MLFEKEPNAGTWIYKTGGVQPHGLFLHTEEKGVYNNFMLFVDVIDKALKPVQNPNEKE